MVIAEQLSQNPNLNIVLLEAGPDGTNEPLMNTPAYGPRMTGTRYVWNFTSQPDPNLGGRTPELAQGHALGGGSAVNYMAYCRGSPSVFDDWARISGNVGLKWKSLLADFKATSHYKAQRSVHDQYTDTGSRRRHRWLVQTASCLCPLRLRRVQAFRSFRMLTLNEIF
ncbi:uncharacterized protein RCC_12140 [Ramularia collo-cygni]|uniref:Glucose-methanol-choline oxidoreductase N-terminal domain-containing protein n=1 Tax=Ramularia collo-cygni TaxID=112498 RepID=A0A2D3ULE0_9PEZI|nr:uncharacterized protein RCC_12140 [Ramularia collo-cygni]CZT14632.1 uncharacterized protein RCC_12140 [Ramularia collo-cygni]